MKLSIPVAIWMATLAPLAAQTKSIVGTISGFRAEAAEVEIRPDKGEPATVKLAPDTTFLRVGAGEKDLTKAQPIQPTTLAIGDRVLVTLAPTGEARRIVVMPLTAIEQRRAAERQDWAHRGLGGVVASVKGDEITLRLHGDTTAVITVNNKTVIRRYAPDSVLFADAKISDIASVRPGDQLRARGEKSADGLKLAAEEVVFGTFVTKAGTVTAVAADAGEITIKDLETKKPLTIKVTADSQLKRMPEMPGMGMPRGPFGGAAPGMTRPGGPRDLSAMLERMPQAKLADLKTGETIVVSSTRGASMKQITAIMLLANAQPLIDMATATAQRRPQRGGVGMGNGLSVDSMMQGLEMPGIIP